MDKQEMKVELVATGNVDVAGVRYRKGDKFSVGSAQEARFLIDGKFAKAAPEDDGDGAEGAKPTAETAVAPGATAQDGTSDERTTGTGGVTNSSPGSPAGTTVSTDGSTRRSK